MRTEREIRKFRDDVRKVMPHTSVGGCLEDLTILDNTLTWVLEEDVGEIDSAIEDITAAASEMPS